MITRPSGVAGRPAFGRHRIAGRLRPEFLPESAGASPGHAWRRGGDHRPAGDAVCRGAGAGGPGGERGGGSSSRPGRDEGRGGVSIPRGRSGPRRAAQGPVRRRVVLGDFASYRSCWAAGTALPAFDRRCLRRGDSTPRAALEVDHRSSSSTAAALRRAALEPGGVLHDAEERRHVHRAGLRRGGASVRVTGGGLIDHHGEVLRRQPELLGGGMSPLVRWRSKRCLTTGQTVTPLRTVPAVGGGWGVGRVG
jgi:hypothetical protein